MNCAECKELLVAYIEGLLDKSQNQTVAEHLKDCRICQAEVKQLSNLHDRLTKNGNALALSNLEDDVMNKILQEQNARLKAASKASTGLKLRRIIMKSKITKLAAAAVIIAGVLIGMHFIGSPIVATPTFAQVIQPIFNAQTAILDIIVGEEEAGGPVIHDIVRGSRIRRTLSNIDSVSIIDLEAGKILSLDSKKKEAAYINLKGLPSMPNYMETLRNIITELQEHPEFTVEKLSEQEIGGQRLIGFRATSPQAELTIWADPETALPVRIEQIGRQMKVICKNLVFDVPMDEELFSMDVPEGYKLQETKLDLMGSTEEDFIEGLRIRTEVLGDGRFPEGVAVEDYLKQVPTITQKIQGLGLSEEQATELGMKLSRHLLFIRFFKGEGEWHYMGKDVKFGDADAPVFWYQPKGSENYRVIYGDLHVEEVTIEKLTEILSKPLNPEPKAIKPRPADGAQGTQLSELQLRWMPGAYVTKHKVYFGTNADSLSLLTEVSDSSSTLAPALQRQTSYYWRIDEIQPDGSIVTGDIWSFNTGRLVAWWTLDGGSGDIAIDGSSNGHDGNLVGDASWALGIIGGALKFDGDGDYVDIGNIPALNITNQITVSAWIKVDAFNKDWQTIIAKGDSAWRLQRDNNSNHLEFACTGLAVPGATWSNIFGTIDVNDGQWHHVVGVYDGNMMYLYTDGNLDTSAKASGTILTNNRPVYIGENAERPGRSWNGLIDDVQIYNYALTADEIASVYKKKIAITGH